MLETIDTSMIDWARAQFALTAIYHWLFVPLTLGLAVVMGIMETLYVTTGNEFWKRTAKFWMKLFGINFAIVCRRYIRCTAGDRRYSGFLYGSYFRGCDVFRMEQSQQEVPLGIYMAHRIGCNHIGLVDFGCKLMDAISRGNGVQPRNNA